MSEQIDLMQSAIDRIEINIAHESVSLRRATMRVLGRMLNFIEEDRLSDIARAIDDKRLQLSDVEQAFGSWATSSGAKSFRYFLAIIERKTESRKVARANNRPFVPPERNSPNQKFFDDQHAADEFVNYLIDEDVPSREFHTAGRICIHAPNAESLYETYIRSRKDGENVHD